MGNLGYCNSCAAKLTAMNVGATVIAASGIWCNKPACIKSAKRWQKKFLKENLPNLEPETL